VGSAVKKDGGALALTGRKRKASQKKMTTASDEEESDEVRIFSRVHFENIRRARESKEGKRLEWCSRILLSVDLLSIAFDIREPIKRMVPSYVYSLLVNSNFCRCTADGSASQHA
jgi:hypothetical protein